MISSYLTGPCTIWEWHTIQSKTYLMYIIIQPRVPVAAQQGNVEWITEVGWRVGLSIQGTVGWYKIYVAVLECLLSYPAEVNHIFQNSHSGETPGTTRSLELEWKSQKNITPKCIDHKINILCCTPVACLSIFLYPHSCCYLTVADRCEMGRHLLSILYENSTTPRAPLTYHLLMV